jgi:hypothetical protein
MSGDNLSFNRISAVEFVNVGTITVRDHNVTGQMTTGSLTVTGDLMVSGSIGGVAATGNLQTVTSGTGNVTSHHLQLNGGLHTTNVSADNYTGNAKLLTNTTDVTPGSTHGTASSVPQITINSDGRLSQITDVPIEIASSQISGLVDFTKLSNVTLQNVTSSDGNVTSHHLQLDGGLSTGSKFSVSTSDANVVTVDGNISVNGYLYGNAYYLTGIPVSSGGGGGVGSLQSVTDTGNTTTNVVQFVSGLTIGGSLIQSSIPINETFTSSDTLSIFVETIVDVVCIGGGGGGGTLSGDGTNGGDSSFFGITGGGGTGGRLSAGPGLGGTGTYKGGNGYYDGGGGGAAGSGGPGGDGVQGGIGGQGGAGGSLGVPGGAGGSSGLSGQFPGGGGGGLNGGGGGGCSIGTVTLTPGVYPVTVGTGGGVVVIRSRENKYLHVHSNVAIGSNLLVSDTDSNVLVVTGNAYTSGTLQVGSNLIVSDSVSANRFIGDGSGLTGVVSNLLQVTTVDSVTTDVCTFINGIKTGGPTGISNLSPIHTLDVGSNLWVSDATSTVLSVNGDISAKNIYLNGNLFDGTVEPSNLLQVTTRGNTTSEVCTFTNGILTWGGHTGISNLNPIHTLDVGSNLWVSDTGSTVLSVEGDISAKNIYLNGNLFNGTVEVSSLQQVTSTGHVTSDIVEFTNGFVSGGNTGISNLNPIHTLDVGSNLWVSDADSNVLTVNGSISVGNIFMNGTLFTNSNLLQVTNLDNVATSVLQFQNGFIAGSNVTVSPIASNVIQVTGNVSATRFIGDGSRLTNVSTVSNLHQVTTNSNATTNVLRFLNGFTAGSNVTVSPTSSNVLAVTGNVSATRFIGDGTTLTGINLDNVISKGAATTKPSFNAGLSINTVTLNSIAINDISIGTGSGSGGNYTVSIGQSTGQVSQNAYAVAIGQVAGQTNQGTSSVAVGDQAGNSGQGDGSVALGKYAGNLNQGVTGADGSGSNSIAIGNEAGRSNQNAYAVAMGAYAGQGTQGKSAVAIGHKAGQAGQGNFAVAVGYGAGNGNQAPNSIVLNASGSVLDVATPGTFYVKPVRSANQSGSLMAYTSYSEVYSSGVTIDAQSNLSTTGALTVNGVALRSTTGKYDVSLGYQAGTGADNAISIGYQTSSSSNSVAIGFQAGATGIHAVSIGSQAGQTGQLDLAIAVGYQAGQTNQGVNAVAIGGAAGYISQNTLSVAIGQGAGEIGQYASSVAVGHGAGNQGQKNNAVAVGEQAGCNYQGVGTVAIGQEAARNDQGFGAISIGYQAGYTSQNDYSVALGWTAGQITQGTKCVAIGPNAGQTNQGDKSIAIGYSAGNTDQPANSIVINASGVTLNGASTSAFYVSPIRSDTIAGNTLLYNPSTKEIFQSPTVTGLYTTSTSFTTSVAGVYTFVCLAGGGGAGDSRGNGGRGGDSNVVINGVTKLWAYGGSPGLNNGGPDGDTYYKSPGGGYDSGLSDGYTGGYGGYKARTTSQFGSGGGGGAAGYTGNGGDGGNEIGRYANGGQGVVPFVGCQPGPGGTGTGSVFGGSFGGGGGGDSDDGMGSGCSGGGGGGIAFKSSIYVAAGSTITLTVGAGGSRSGNGGAGGPGAIYIDSYPIFTRS